ncbi:hypothetical protein [Desulfobulbus propionicus]
MNPEVIEAGKNLSPIIVAIIGGFAGLVSGVIASLAAPWVQYAIELRRKNFEYKKEKINEIKELLSKTSDMDEIERSPLWGFVRENLNEEEKKIVYPGAIVVMVSNNGSQSSLTQDDLKKQGISKMVYRLEKEWKLLKT